MSKNKIKIIKSFIYLIMILGISFSIYLINQKKEQEIYQIKKEFLDFGKIPSNEELLKKKTEISQNKVLLENRFFDKNNPIGFIEIIETLGKNNSVILTVDKVDVVEEGITLDASVSGTLENLRAFVFDVENMEKEINIKNVRFNKIVTEKSAYWSVYLNIVGKIK